MISLLSLTFTDVFIFPIPVTCSCLLASVCMSFCTQRFHVQIGVGRQSQPSGVPTEVVQYFKEPFHLHPLVLKPFPYWCKLSDGFQLQWLTEGLSEMHPTRVTTLFGWSQTSNRGSYTYILASERVILSSQLERASPFLILHHVLLTLTSWKSVCRGSSCIVAGGTGAKPSSDTGMFPERKISS